MSTTDFVFQKKVELLLEPSTISSNGFWTSYTPDHFYEKFLELEGSFEKGSNSLGINYKTIFPNLSEKFDKLKATLEAYNMSYQQSEFFGNPQKAFDLYKEQNPDQEIFSYNEFKNPQKLMEEVRQAFVNDMRSEDFIQLSKDPIIFDRVSELRFKSHEIDLELREEEPVKPQEQQPTKEEPQPTSSGRF